MEIIYLVLKWAEGVVALAHVCKLIGELYMIKTLFQLLYCKMNRFLTYDIYWCLHKFQIT